MSLPVIELARSRLRSRPVVLIAGALAYALIGGTFRTFTVPAMVWTALGGLAILLFAWLGARSPAPVRASREGLTLWTIWLAAATGWELWALSMHPRGTHPTISSLLNNLVETYPGRSVALLAWLALGWWLGRR